MLPLPRLRLQLLSVAHYIIYRLVNHLRHLGGRCSREEEAGSRRATQPSPTRTDNYDYIKRFAHQLLTEALRDDRGLRSAFRRARQARYVRHERPPLTRDREAGT